jgi:hypothetical protein
LSFLTHSRSQLGITGSRPPWITPRSVNDYKEHVNPS